MKRRLARSPGSGPESESEDGHGYLVSASDLLAGLLFLFIIMLTSFAIDLAKEKDRAVVRQVQALAAEHKAKQLQKEAAELQRKLEEERRRVEELQKRATQENQRLRSAEDLRAEFIDKLRDQLKESGLDVTVDFEHGLMRLPEEVLFRSGTDEFSDGGQQSLALLAASLVQLLPHYSGRSATAASPTTAPAGAALEAINVEGHTDSRPKRNDGRFRDNWDLSAARAIRTYKVLVELEPALAAFTNPSGEPLFGVAGYADSRLIDKGHAPEEQARNRRIDLRFLMAPPRGKVADIPGGDAR